MIAFVGGVVLALSLHFATGLNWALVVTFWMCAVPVQVAYTRRLNSFLGGSDPVATFGARNLRQLKSIIPVPLSVTVLNVLSKAMGWAGLVALLLSVGLLRTT
jgi:hypothetical protein